MLEEEEADPWRPLSLGVFILMLAVSVGGDSLETDREALMNLKLFLEQQNPVNRGRYSQWNNGSSNPCDWYGVSCSPDRTRVTGLDLSDNQIWGPMFNNFSALTKLQYLDLSQNSLHGAIDEDLSRCNNLVHLNLSHNTLEGELRLSGLPSLGMLDLSTNRFTGMLQFSFPAICNRLVAANLSVNDFSGTMDGCFDSCSHLKYLDLSSNKFTGGIWSGMSNLVEFSVSENYFSGSISGSTFGQNCSLKVLDLSVNNITGHIPPEISNCSGLVSLNLWGNKFAGQIPSEVGSISGLQGLYLGNNSFSRVIPDSLLDLKNLSFLDLSNNDFGGEIQKIFGRFTQVKFLVLHSNSYSRGIESSGILSLQSLLRLDLSYNYFPGPLPIGISQMTSLKFLILAHNQFTGTIPSEYGNLLELQALDLSFNILTGSIPASIGNLSSLLWLMLANNSLTSEIPVEIGNCRSLLWLNLANNKLSGNIPVELTNIGKNATPTFESNLQSNGVIAASGECLAMKRWIPADYPPFSFVFSILTRKTCRSIWDNLLKGNGIFPMCAPGTGVRRFLISGYIQLSGNQFTGEVPSDIGKMSNFTMLHLGFNNFYGELPKQIGNLPLAVLNLTCNRFSGEIPAEIGSIKCLRNLDLSFNNFSGTFPAGFNNLTDLSKFNISFNPLISGEIPGTGQLATFENTSFLGDPFLQLPDFISHSSNLHPTNTTSKRKGKRTTKLAVFLVFFTLTLVAVLFGVLSFVVCILGTSPEKDSPGFLLEETTYKHDTGSSSSCSSPWLSDSVKVIRLGKTAFTHSDILKATCNFSEGMIVGKGGFGTVYRGVLPDGRQVAVKKLQREGREGDKEFQAEMEVLSGNNGFGWPHPNLVTLYGWCLNGSEKLLVYEYMEGGSLEDLIFDRVRLTWRRRIDIAIDIARALVFLHHECYPAIVHRDVKASNVLLDKDGRARVTDFGLARVVDDGDSHVSTMVAGTVGYVAPEYGQTWQATTKGDVYSYGVLAMELATGRRALDGGEECLVEWGRRVMGNGRLGIATTAIPVLLLGSGLAEGAEEMCELLRIGVRCTAGAPLARPNMKEVLIMLHNISNCKGLAHHS